MCVMYPEADGRPGFQRGRTAALTIIAPLARVARSNIKRRSRPGAAQLKKRGDSRGAEPGPSGGRQDGAT